MTSASSSALAARTLSRSDFVGPEATSVPEIDRPFIALVTANPSKYCAAGPAAGADLLYLPLDP